MMFLVIPLSGFQSFCDKIDIPFGRSDAGRRLFLERVEDVHRLLEPDRVHRSIGVSVVGLDDLQDAWTKPLPRLRRWRGTAEPARYREHCPCPPWPPQENSRNRA